MSGNVHSQQLKSPVTSHKSPAEKQKHFFIFCLYGCLVTSVGCLFSSQLFAVTTTSDKSKISQSSTPVQTLSSDEFEKLPGNRPPLTTLISATRRDTPVEDITRSATVITRPEIERSGKVFLLDLLRGVSGVHVVQLGTYGRETQVHIRGLNKESTLIMMDGVQITNPNQQLAALQHLTTANIEQIEIIRGPQSVLYGADAAGGMINIVTRKETNKGIHGSGQFQYGTFDTFYEEGQLSEVGEKFAVSAAGGRMDSDGLAENDDYENTTASVRAKVNLTENSEWDTTFHHFNSITGIDDGFVSGNFRTDPNRNTRANQQVLNSRYTVSTAEWWDQYVQYSLFHDFSFSNDPRNPDVFTGADPESFLSINSNRHTFEYQSNFHIQDFDELTVGYEFEHSTIYSTNYTRQTRNHGWFAQNELTLWDIWTIVGGARIDSHELYGTEVSPLVSTGLWIAKTMTKLKASYGKAFRSPTFNQLFFPNFGDPNLQPETSWSWDAGFEQFYWDERASFSMMYFDSKSRNLIQNLALATNIGSARSRGIEFEHKIEIFKDLYFFTNYTYTDSFDRSTRKRLLRVPRHMGKFGLTYDYQRFHFTGDWVWVGSREDSAATRLDEYTRLDMNMAFDLTDFFQLFGRIDNATDDRYQEGRGFNMPFTTFTIGTKGKF
jgi:vitamin B12 transporter